MSPTFRPRPAASPLNPAQAMERALERFAGHGFIEAARNTRGDSVYLRRAGCDLALRVSNHARTPKQRRNHPEVATSLVLREPKSAAQVDALVAAALRNFEAGRAGRKRA